MAGGGPTALNGSRMEDGRWRMEDGGCGSVLKPRASGLRLAKSGVGPGRANDQRHLNGPIESGLANLMSQIVTSRLQIFYFQYVTTYCLLQGRRAEWCEIRSWAELEKPSFASECR